MTLTKFQVLYHAEEGEEEIDTTLLKYCMVYLHTAEVNSKGRLISVISKVPFVEL